jgi:hypothetical protein
MIQFSSTVAKHFMLACEQENCSTKQSLEPGRAFSSAQTNSVERASRVGLASHFGVAVQVTCLRPCRLRRLPVEEGCNISIELTEVLGFHLHLSASAGRSGPLFLQLRRASDCRRRSFAYNASVRSSFAYLPRPSQGRSIRQLKRLAAPAENVLAPVYNIAADLCQPGAFVFWEQFVGSLLSGRLFHFEFVLWCSSRLAAFPSSFCECGPSVSFHHDAKPRIQGSHARQ